MMWAFKQLDLTDEQKAEIRTIMEEHRPAMMKWHEENKELIEAHRKEMRAAIEAGDHEKARELRSAFQEANKPPMAELEQQINAVLTDEQKAKLEKIKAEHLQRMEQRGPDGKGDDDRPRRQRKPRDDNRGGNQLDI